MEIIREILASHRSGISRDGLLAWARLRGDPGMTDAQLEAALSELGAAVVDDQGFLYLREFAPSAAREAGDAARISAHPSEPASPVVPEPTGSGAWLAAEQPGMAVDGNAWVAPDGRAWPAPPASNRRLMLGSTIGVIIFLVVAGLGASILRQGVTTESTGPSAPAPATPTGGSVVGATDLAVGDCIVLPSEDQFNELRRLPCTDPHGGEVFFIADDPATAYPTDDEFQAWVQEQCMPAFATYTGSAYDSQDALDVGWFTPTSDSWDGGDRGVTCYVTPSGGTLTTQSFRDATP